MRSNGASVPFPPTAFRAKLLAAFTVSCSASRCSRCDPDGQRGSGHACKSWRRVEINGHINDDVRIQKNRIDL
jgi:hypothetical protein